jgi:amino acid transporter
MEEEQRAYRPGYLLIWLAMIALLLVLTLIAYRRIEWTALSVILVALIVLIPTVQGALAFIFPHVVITNRNITVSRGLIRKRKTFSWDEIEKVQGKWKTEVEVVPISGPSVQILFHHLSKKDRESLRQDLHKYLGDRVKVTEET